MGKKKEYADHKAASADQDSRRPSTELTKMICAHIQENAERPSETPLEDDTHLRQLFADQRRAMESEDFLQHVALMYDFDHQRKLRASASELPA